MRGRRAPSQRNASITGGAGTAESPRSTTSRPPSRTSVMTATCRLRRTMTTAMPFSHPTLHLLLPGREARRSASAGSTASGSGRRASGRRRSATRTRAPSSGSAPSTRPMTPPGPTMLPPAASAAARQRSTSLLRLRRGRAAQTAEPRRNRDAHLRRRRRTLLQQQPTQSISKVATLPQVADSPPKNPSVDEDSSAGSGGGAALGFANELGFDPFMLFQLPCSDTYQSIDSFFAGETDIQDVTGVNSGMDGGSLWSFDDFPMDAPLF